MSSERGDAAADRARLAAARAAEAGRRAAELQARLWSLSRGDGSSDPWPEAALAAYEHALVRAAESKQSAIFAFRHAANAHRSAAEAARCCGDLDRASLELDLARADDRSAETLAEASN